MDTVTIGFNMEPWYILSGIFILVVWWVFSSLTAVRCNKCGRVMNVRDGVGQQAKAECSCPNVEYTSYGVKRNLTKKQRIDLYRDGLEYTKNIKVKNEKK